jgi:hypothetical protein
MFCISLAPARLDRYPCGFTGHVAHPGRSIVSRQLPAALDGYLTALPAMSLAPVAPFLSAEPCWCDLHNAHAERLGAITALGEF